MPKIHKIIKNTFYKSNSTKSIEVQIYNKQGKIIYRKYNNFFEEWDYDYEGNLTHYANPQFSEIYLIDKIRNETSYQNSKGVKWLKKYDDNKNEIFFKEPRNWNFHINRIVKISRDKIKGLEWSKKYDLKNNEIYYEDNFGVIITTHYDYDRFGNTILIKKSNETKPSIKLYEYDDLGNIVHFKDDEKFWRKEFDQDGNLIEYEDIDGKIEYRYDYSLLQYEVHSNGIKTQYEYDDFCNIISVENNRGFKEIREYNEFDEITAIENNYISQQIDYVYY